MSAPVSIWLLMSSCPAPERSDMFRDQKQERECRASRRIGLPIRVEMRADGQPGGFTWRGEAYFVLECNEPWHLTDRWWISATEADANGGKGFADRFYYRVRAQERGAHFELVCDLYYERAHNVWVLDVIQD